MLYRFPKCFGVYCVVTVNKNMAHTLYLTPVNITVCRPELVRQHIYRLTNNLN